MWRFVQITDPHLGSYTDGRWNNRFICTMMPDVMRCLRRDLRESKPAFVFATGDLASQPNRDAMFAARDFLDWLGIPYYPMGGNHDFVVEESREWFLEAFHAHLPNSETYYAFDHEKLHFVVLDPWWLWRDGSLMPYSERHANLITNSDDNRPRWALPDDQLAWLDADLKKNAARPTVIGCHYPAIGIPDRLRRPEMNDAGSLQNGDALRKVLRAHPQVKAVFSGHLHMNIIELIDGVAHVVTAALPEYPTEYREVSIYEDRLEVGTRGLSDPTFAARSLIPGFGWTAGQPCDRSVTIPFT